MEASKEKVIATTMATEKASVCTTITTTKTTGELHVAASLITVRDTKATTTHVPQEVVESRGNASNSMPVDDKGKMPWRPRSQR